MSKKISWCFHLWRRRYYPAKGRGHCESCLKRHPDYWKWKLQVRKESAIDCNQSE